MRDLIEQRRKAMSADDLLGVLVQGEVDGDRLDDNSIVHEAILLLIGGDETSRHVISGGMEALLRRPEQFDDLRGDRELLPGTVEEMLRWVTPIKNFQRTTTVDVELHDQAIAAGSSVLLLYPSANRDETVFDDPETFDIRRQPNDHIAFGFGAHLCLGHRLARAEITGMMDRILERLPDIHLAGDDANPLRVSNFIVGFETLPVEFTPSAPVGGIRAPPSPLRQRLPRRPARRSAGPPRRTRSSCRARPGGRGGCGRAGPPPGPRSSWPACWLPTLRPPRRG